MKYKVRFKHVLLTGVVLSAHILTTATGHSATRSWDGGGTNAFWDAAPNWSGNVAPLNGDILAFPTNAARLSNTNRASSGLTNFSSIRFTGNGYDVFSGSLNITNGITNAPLVGKENRLNARLQLRANQSWFVDGLSSLRLSSNVSFPGTPFTLTMNVGQKGNLNLEGSFTGNTSVSLVKLGQGTLDLNGDTNVVGDFIVADGILNVDGFLNAALVISNGAILQGTGSVLSVTCAGEIRPGGNVPGSLQIRSGGSPILQPGSKLLMNINGLNAGKDYDQIQTGLAFPLTHAQLVITRSPTFPFTIGQKFVLVNNLAVGMQFLTTFTNLPHNSLINDNGVIFQISYAGGSGNDVELTVVDVPFERTGFDRVWDGSLGTANANWNTAANWNNDALPGAGDSLIFPVSAPPDSRTMTNDFDFATARFDRLWFGGDGGPWILHGNGLKVFGGLVATNDTSSGTIELRTANIELAGPQSWALTNFDLQVATPLLFKNHTLTVAPEPDQVVTFDGELFGPGTLLVKEGFVNLPSNLPVSNVLVRVEGGQVEALEVQASGPTWELLGGRLTFGSADIPSLDATGGELNLLGDAQVAIGGDLVLGGGCTVIASFDTITNTPLTVAGLVHISGAQLHAGPADISLLNATLMLLDNRSNKPVFGTFAGLSQGTVLAFTNAANDVIFSRISYTGGDGNDVTLQVVGLAPRFTELSFLANGNVLLRGITSPQTIVRFEASENLSNWTSIGAIQANTQGGFTFQAGPRTSDKRFFRAFIQ